MFESTHIYLYVRLVKKFRFNYINTPPLVPVRIPEVMATIKYDIPELCFDYYRAVINRTTLIFLSLPIMDERIGLLQICWYILHLYRCHICQVVMIYYPWDP